MAVMYAGAMLPWIELMSNLPGRKDPLVHVPLTASVIPWSRATALLSTALIAGVLLLAACGDSGSDAPEVPDPVETGTELVTRYLTLVRDQDVEGLEDFISDAFIIQRADGSHSEKPAYLENLPELREFTVADVSAQQAAGALIVRWMLTIDEEIGGAQFSQEPAPRLTTFVYEDGDWRLSSHANFNVPEAVGEQ